MDKIINGKELVEGIKDEVAKGVFALGGDRPNLAIVLVGDRPDSVLYVNLKEKEAVALGIDTHLYRMPANITEQEVIDAITHLNTDDEIDAILVQLPLPKEINTNKVIAAIDPKKDVDRFHPESIKEIKAACSEDHVLPPVFGAVFEILKNIDYKSEGKTACVVSNADIFSDGLSNLLECKGFKALTAHPDDKDLKEKTLQSDVLVTIIGRPKFITEDMVKKDAVVIDVGTNKKEDELCGDVDFKNVLEKVSHITPVPGGVGPMTIALLFQNTLKLHKSRKK